MCMNKANNKITELRTILQRESQNSYVYKQTKSVHQVVVWVIWRLLLHCSRNIMTVRFMNDTGIPGETTYQLQVIFPFSLFYNDMKYSVRRVLQLN